MLQNINPYNQQTFETEFKQTNLYQTLTNDFDEILFNYIRKDYEAGTPRQHQGDPGCVKTKFSAVPFYYINWLLNETPNNIYDLGCGWNIFKKYIPNIIGVGAEDPSSNWFYADIHDYVDDDYIQGHQNFFESMFSICALHYVPLSTIRQRVIDIGSMLRPGGKGWLAFNLARLLERDRKQFGQCDEVQLENYVRTELYNLPFEIEVFDLDFSEFENGLDGNIHLVFKK